MMRPAALAVLCLSLLALPLPARANCAVGTTYSPRVTGTTVTICLVNVEGRTCPDQGLLRRRADTGATVVLTDCNPSGCFVDECVPPGDYQYGLVKPYQCNRASCGSYYFSTATVGPADGGPCSRTPGFTGPRPFTGTVPWGDQQRICDHGVMGCATTGAVLSVNALALALGSALTLLRRRRARSQSR